MIRKLLSLTLLSALFLCPAIAQETLPEGVSALCAARYPGYAVSAFDGWGNENQGQYALVLSLKGDNILCIAEKAQDDAAYAFTVENTNAVREGDDIPSLLIDTGGDSLFYSYWDQGLYKRGYHSLRQDGQWGTVTLEYMDTSNAEYDLDRFITVWNGELHFDTAVFSKLENPHPGVKITDPMPIPVSEAFTRSLALSAFDIDMLSHSPQFLPAQEGLCDGLLETGDTLLQVQATSKDIIMLVKKQDGTKRLRICRGWNDARNDYAVEESLPLPAEAALDTYHAGEDLILLGLRGEALVCSFLRGPQDRWYPNTMQGKETYALGYDCAEDLSRSSLYRSDGAVYGNAPWSGDLMTIDMTSLPETFDEAAAMLDKGGYAFVCNPNPADRLHLREAPKKSAASKGKFYNRTPVEVLSVEGEWANVRIGRGLYGFTGYMMTQYLAFGSDTETVACAFPQLLTVESSSPVPLHCGPDARTEVVESLNGETYYIVGVHGDDWLIVMTRNGVIGYARRSDFWEGNG